VPTEFSELNNYRLSQTSKDSAGYDIPADYTTEGEGGAASSPFGGGLGADSYPPISSGSAVAATDWNPWATDDTAAGAGANAGDGDGDAATGVGASRFDIGFDYRLEEPLSPTTPTNIAPPKLDAGG
jgi:hypothetical protein